jgi:hypothetical protein
VAGHQDRPHAAEAARDDLVQRMERLPPGHPSSPYNDDGSRKPPVPRHSDRELPLPDEQAPDPELDAEGGEAPDQRSLDPQDLTDRAPESPEGAQPDRRSWSEAVPHLKEQWERHQERWPKEQRPQVDRSTDEPGSWRGDSGRQLSARNNAHVDAGCDQIAKAETRITDRMEDTGRASVGELTGKEYRLKERDRLKDKVAAELATNFDADVHEVMASVHDGVRYTLQYSEAEYSSGVLADITCMKDQGFKLTRLKNLWSDAEYKGINSQWHDNETGQAFEMQFHTQASFEAKQITHKAYERLRNQQKTAGKESRELKNYQCEVTSRIPIPNGALDIPEYP